MDSSLPGTVKYAQRLQRHFLQAYNPTPAAPPSRSKSKEAIIWYFISSCYSFIKIPCEWKKNMQ